MKICVINSLYRPYVRGGAEVIVDQVVKGLEQAGHDVVVITLGKHTEVERHGRVTVYRVKPWNIFSFLSINHMPTVLRVLWHPLDMINIHAAFLVKTILKKEQPDIVMTHNIKGLSYLLPRVVRSLGLRHWHTIHDVQLSRPSGLILFGKEKPFVILDTIYEKICRWLFGSPERIISPSKWLLDYYRRRGFFSHSKMVVLQNPVAFREIKKHSEGRSDVRVTFLYVGQIESAKGILFLLHTCRQLSSPDWRLTIVGDGGSRHAVEKLCAADSRCAYVGRVSRDEVTNYYRSADVTIVPSLCYENSPSVITESLAANVPVIAADIGGIPELVRDDYNGFTFAPGDEESLLRVLNHFIDHPALIEQLKKNCFVSVRGLSLVNYIKTLTSFF